MRFTVPKPHSAIQRMSFIHKGARALEFCEDSSTVWGAMELDRFLIALFNSAGVRWHYFDESPIATIKVAPEQSHLYTKRN